MLGDPQGKYLELKMVVNKSPTQNRPIVRTQAGILSGFQEDKIYKFFGIPYALPPVGELRWRGPQPLLPWSGIRNADSFQMIAPQIGNVAPKELKRGPGQSEDCLYLNIWTPSISSGDRLPVMVWIHGGGFMNGSGSLAAYDGTKLAQEGVVLVTINYRLGPLGNLVHPELEAESSNSCSGNYGILDQIAALDWIQQNVSSFGGDPQNVAIFGQSAGAMSAGLLCSSPRSKCLFHKAICQSGGLLAVPREIPYQEALAQGLEFQKSLGVNNLKEMRQVPAEKLISAANILMSKDEMPKKLRFAPVADNVIVWDQSQTLHHRANYPLIIGSNQDEATFFTSRMPRMTRDYYRQAIRSYFGDKSLAVLEAFPANTDQEAESQFLKLHTHNLFTVPVYDLARKLSMMGDRVFIYRFIRLAPQNQANGKGVSHGEEIPYVFGNVQAEGYIEKDLTVSETIRKYWVQFAKTGDPNPKGFPLWPRFTMNSNKYLELGDETLTRSFRDDRVLEKLIRILE
jgi:para-nitrobenzyl esterase